MMVQRKYSIEGSVSVVLFVLLILVVLLQVTGRLNLFDAPVWTEELSRWLWVWMAFIAMGETERTNGHLRMGFLMEMANPKLRKTVYTMIDIAFLAIVAHLCWISYKTILRTASNESVTMPFPDAVMYSAALISFVSIAVRIILRLVTKSQHSIDVDDPDSVLSQGEIK